MRVIDNLWKCLFLSTTFLLSVSSFSQSTTTTAGYVENRVFFTLSMIEEDTALSDLLENDSTFKEIADHRVSGAKHAIDICGTNTVCISVPFKFTSAETDIVSKRLKELYKSNWVLQQWVEIRLRKSRHFPLYEKYDNADLLLHAWHDQAAAINQIIDVYADGAPPPSPIIDSPSYDVNSVHYGQVVNTLSRNVLEQDHLALFFEPSLKFALYLLDANRRDEAGRFESLDDGENAEVLGHLKEIRWDAYPYSVILVPGEGPDIAGVALSPGGKARLRLAVKRFREKQAPIILVSGGNVHPSQTPYCEALEMKKALIREFGVPATAVMVDPYARHTTTNLRNATRLIILAGMPANKPVLITTDAYQTAYILDGQFAEKYRAKFGYVPFIRLKSVSPVDLEMGISQDALQLDSRDPLDP